MLFRVDFSISRLVNEFFELKFAMMFVGCSVLLNCILEVFLVKFCPRLLNWCGSMWHSLHAFPQEIISVDIFDFSHQLFVSNVTPCSNILLSRLATYILGFYWLIWSSFSKAYSEPRKTSKIERLGKTVGKS